MNLLWVELSAKEQMGREVSNDFPMNLLWVELSAEEQIRIEVSNDCGVVRCIWKWIPHIYSYFSRVSYYGVQNPLE